MAWHRSGFVRALALVLLAVALCSASAAGADKGAPRRSGKVIIIRGAFTVFSLGMNELGDKLAEHGLDVDVIADISASQVTSDLIEQYKRKRNMGPIVFIGHSRGAELGPREARRLQEHKIPVKLVVMVDGVHATTIPANVEQCVNFYHDSSIGFIHGVPARADSRRTKMRNVDIDQLRTRERGGSINHFNIDSSSWVHELVIREVLKVCPVVGSTAASAAVAKSAPAKRQQAPPANAPPRQPPLTQPPVLAKTQPRSPSGLRYPSEAAGELWAETADSASPAARGSLQSEGEESAPAVPSRTQRPGSNTGKKRTATDSAGSPDTPSAKPAAPSAASGKARKSLSDTSKTEKNRRTSRKEVKPAQ